MVERNSNGTLKGPVWSFTTECGTYSVPYTENFDSYSPPHVGCGTIVNANNDAVKWESKMGLAYSGISRLRIGYNPVGQNHNDWYFTPGLTLTGQQTYEVKFYYKGGSSIYVENLEVKWGNSPTASAMVPNPIFSDVSFYKPNYILATATFTPDASGVYYVGWHCFSMGDQIEISVDQISVNVTSACVSPSNLTAGSIGSTTATIGWNNSGSASRLVYGAPGFDPGGENGTLISTNTNEYTITSLQPGTAYSVYVQNQCSNGIFSGWSGPITFTTENNSKTLNLSLLLEGLFDGNGQMTKAQNGTGSQFPGTTADQIIVELHSAFDYNSIVYQSSLVDLSITGNASITSIPGNINGSYYITVKQRNSIETVSSLPVSFSPAIVNYQFNIPEKAFGNNLAQSGSYFLIHGGDENQDGLVDSSDLNAADNNAASFATGYIASDVNGDGLVDSSDLNLIDNNASAFVSKVTP
ncbi:MAG: fibronectin type III domain-containing protein [Bacteroidales bacterium]|nr:fibronectin type III domain-containing protein [Bacteroidales bacterium]